MKRQIAVVGRTRMALVWAVLLVAVVVALVSLFSLAVHAVPALPAGFQDQVVLEGLDNPTNVEFSPDGRVFVAETCGLIKVFDGLSDPTPTTFADLRTNVYNFWDRGLLGLLDPKTVRLRFASRPTGANLVVGSTSARAPFTRTVIVGSTNSVSAPARLVSDGQDYRFRQWSDGGARIQDIIAPVTDTTYRATYRPTRR